MLTRLGKHCKVFLHLLHRKTKWKAILATRKIEVIFLTKNKQSADENLNVELGGMGLYGTTSNVEVGGYEASGDIENAGKLDKGFKKLNEEDLTPRASLKEEGKEDY